VRAAGNDRIAASPPAAPARSVETDRVAASPASRPDVAPPRTERKAPPRRAEPKKPERKSTEVATASPAPRTERKHAGRSVQDVKAEATGLYRSKNFSGAAQEITSALAGFGNEDTKDLKSLAAIYTQLGKAYAIGLAPSTKPIDAYQALLRAIAYDREVGSAYTPELQDRLAAIAPRAATSYMAARSYEQALQAVRMAESLSSRSDNLKIVRGMLEDTAKELLRAARGELSSDPDAARQKLRQVMAMVEPRNPLYAQAQKLLSGL
jgi:hypothetical protein